MRGSNSGGTSTCTVSSKVCTIFPVKVVSRAKIFAVPRCTPSLFTNVISRFFIWIVIGTKAVSLVTFTKST